MWPWRKKPPTIPAEDPILGEVSKGVLAAISTHSHLLRELGQAIKLLDESVTDARKLETRLHQVENAAKHMKGLFEQEVGRIDLAVSQIRGAQTGAMRGGRRDRMAEDLGAGLIQVLGGDVQRAQQLVLELQQRAGGAIETDPRGQNADDRAIGG